MKDRTNKSFIMRHTKPLPELQPGDVVRIQDEQCKKPLKSAVVKGKTEKPRSYIVSSDGVDYRRNRRHLIKTTELNESNHDQDDFIETTEQDINAQHVPESPENTDNNYTTRSGRTVKFPSKYQDFVL